MSGTLPNDAETGSIDDKDLSPRHDDRPRENDRLPHERACHDGTLNDNDAPREEGLLHEEPSPLLHDEGPLREEGTSDEKRPVLENEAAARDDLAMSSSEGA